jgi:hypothetical protein
MTTRLITIFGWRNSWIICGLFAIIPGVLCTFTMVEPPRSDEVTIEVQENPDGEDDNQLVLQKAKTIIKEKNME